MLRVPQAAEEERPRRERPPQASGGPYDREGAHHGRQGAPLDAEHYPEERPVEVPYSA